MAASVNTRANAIKSLFRQAAGADRRLSELEMARLAQNLSQQLRIPADTFGEVRLMFYRYDFSGDGQLDEEEGVMLIEGMLRAAKDAKDPKGARAGMLNMGQIPKKRLESCYQTSKKLGQGGQGAVYLAKDLSNGQEKVVKYYDKSCANAPAEDIIDEFALLTKLDHPKIARTYEIFQDTANIYVVSEPYFGGDLSTIVEKATQAGAQITEQWFAGIWSQSLQGVAFLHSKHMMHCDIKEPNIMISSKDNFQNPNVVVIDFGLAQGFSGGGLGAGGTPGYMPPEVWQMGLWTPKGDTFAMGVTFYSMITFQGSPFAYGARSIDDVKMLTLQCRLPQPPPGHLGRSPLLNAMLTRMLGQDFHRRPAISQVLDDPWMKQAAASSTELDKGALRRASRMSEMSGLQKGLLADLASKENLAQMEELSATFAAMDHDNNGLVNADEARQALRGKIPPQDIENLINALIGDQGEVAYTVFMGQMLAATKANSADILRQIFQDLDSDNNGYLTPDELESMMTRDQVQAAMRGKSAQDVMREFGWDRKGRVTWQDFREAFEQTATPSSSQSVFNRGDTVEYFSPSYGKWVPGQVTEVRSDGAITISIKPGYWFSPADQRNKLKAPGGGYGGSASPGLQLLHAGLGM